MALLYGRAGRCTTLFCGFRPGQYVGLAFSLAVPVALALVATWRVWWPTNADEDAVGCPRVRSVALASTAASCMTLRGVRPPLTHNITQTRSALSGSVSKSSEPWGQARRAFQEHVAMLVSQLKERFMEAQIDIENAFIVRTRPGCSAAAVP
jgi:hypothetical protein